MKKRLLAIMLVIAMVFTMGIAAFAADGTSSITINGATKDRTYRIYKVFDATYSADGTSVAYNYTKGGKLDSVLFGTDGETSAAGSPFEMKKSTTTGVYNVYKKSSASESGIALFLRENVDKLEYLSGKDFVATGDSTKDKFVGLTPGYYFVMTTDDDGKDVAVGSISVNTTAEIDTKDQPPTPKDGKYKVIKTAAGDVTEVSANIGDTIVYELRINTLDSYDGKVITEYTAYDTKGAGMEQFTLNSVSVGGVEISSSAYTYTAQTDAEPASISIPWVDDDGNNLYAENAEITISAQAVVSENAFIGKGSTTEPNTNTNNGKFNWTYADGSTYRKVSELASTTTTVYVYAASVYKSDNLGNPLAGAKFNLLDQNGNKIYFEETSEEGVYSYVASTATGALDEAVTPENGKITIKGLKSDTTISYKFHETAAPSGYNLLESDVDVLNSDFEASSKKLTIHQDADGNIVDSTTGTKTMTVNYTYSSAAKNIVNNKGTELPKTGGIGTTIFYIIGGIIVAGAIVFFVTRRRMDSKNKA